jgi:hypothetical protein
MPKIQFKLQIEYWKSEFRSNHFKGGTFIIYEYLLIMLSVIFFLYKMWSFVHNNQFSNVDLIVAEISE